MAVGSMKRKEPKAVPSEMFSHGTILGLKHELLGINRSRYDESTARKMTNEQFSVLELAMGDRKKDPSELFSKFDPVAAAYLTAIWRTLDRTYPKNFPSFPPGVTFTKKQSDSIKKTTRRILRSRTIKVTDSSKNKYLILFSRDYSAAEKRRLNRELTKWKRKPMPLAEAFVRSDVFADQVFKIEKDRTLTSVDPLNVIGRSMIRGPAKNFIYNQMGLESHSLVVLESTLAYEAKDPSFDEVGFFKLYIKDPDQRDLAILAFSHLGLKKPKRGAYASYAADITELEASMRQREKEIAAFNLPFNARNWNVASINTTQGMLYITIPKKLMKPREFKILVNTLQANIDANRPFPEALELKLLYGLPIYARTEMIFQQRKGGKFVPPSEKQLARLDAGELRPTQIKLLGKPKRKTA